MANLSTAEDGKLQYEAGQDFTDYTALTDDGDNKTFYSSATLWSGRSGYDVSVRPNGLVSGGNVSVADSGSNDVVDIAALTCYLAGVSTSVSASTDFAITRGSGDGYKICSITINSSGVLTEVEGAEHTEFSETRGADGGPPWIPTTSIELAQVRLSSTTGAAITASEIKQIINTHCERYDYPVWDVNYYDPDAEKATVEFISAMDEIHSDDAGSTTVTKKVYVSYYEPEFADQPYANDFTPPVNSHSVSSTQVYGTTIASRSSSLNQGSFTAFLKDGITDNLVSYQDEILWFKFYPDRNKSPYLLCQGKLGMEPSYPAGGGNISAACTISATVAGYGIAS